MYFWVNDRSPRIEMLFKKMGDLFLHVTLDRLTKCTNGCKTLFLETTICKDIRLICVVLDKKS